MTPRVSLIVGMTRNRVIGKDNRLPWKLPRDLKYFKETTLGSPIIMGRKTLDSMGRALPGRLNLVISTQPEKIAAPAIGVPSLEAAIARAQRENTQEIFIIGGAQIFENALPRADRLYITWIDSPFDGDVFFPNFALENFREISRFSFSGPFPHHFCVYELRSGVGGFGASQVPIRRDIYG
jgi:dihydrofolate reductase